MAGLARATRLRGGQVQQKLFHWKKKVTCGRDRRNRGRGLSSHLAPASDRVPGVTVTWGYHSKQLGPRGLACEWPLKSIWALWPGASGGHLEEDLKVRPGHGKLSPTLSVPAHGPLCL